MQQRKSQKLPRGAVHFFFWKVLIVTRIWFFIPFATTTHNCHFNSLSQLLHNPLPAMVYTTPTKRACIIQLKEAGHSYKEIGAKFNLHWSTVYCIHCRYAQTKDFYYVKPKPGHPCKFTTHDTHVAVRTLASSEAHDVANLQRLCFPNITAETIQKRLANCGLKAYIHHTKPYLSLAKKRACLEWAKAHKHWTINDWKTVIFSDESKFNLFGSDGCYYCWRKPGQEFDERYVQKVIKHGASGKWELA